MVMLCFPLIEAEALLDGSAARAQANNLSLTTGRRFNAAVSSSFFNYRDNIDNSIHQVWFEDAQSLSTKYSAARNLGLRGVGLYVHEL